MESNKNFVIHQTGASTSIAKSPELGRILLRPEVEAIAAQYGAAVIRFGTESFVDLIPPVPDEDLPKLGEALVDLAKNLDSSEPEPTFTIN